MDVRFVPTAAFAEAAACLWQTAIEGFAAPVLGVPTGRTMIPVYARLAENGVRLRAGTRAFAIDEYCWTDPAHPGTNAAFYAAHWPFGALAPVVVPDAAAPEPDSAIAAHCAAIAGAGGFDVVLLGLGRNGHVAFNEPGSDADSGCRVVVLADATRAQIAADWETPPTRGMTVGMRQLLAAQRLILLASGAEKREAVAAAFGASACPAIVPAALLRDHPGLTVLCDEQAAEGLR